MNTLQLLPPGARTAPPGPTGGKPSAGEASSIGKNQAAPPANGPQTSEQPAATANTGKPLTPTASEQLAQARASTAKALDARAEQAEKAAQAAKEAAAAREETAAQANGTLEREVGLIEGTMKVFIDLVEPGSKKSLFRVFGPEDNRPKEEPAAPKTVATNAYTRNTAPTPLKDVGIA